jgi:hypothetical protein
MPVGSALSFVRDVQIISPVKEKKQLLLTPGMTWPIFLEAGRQHTPSLATEHVPP